VGFLPRHVVARAQEVNRLHGKFAQVLELSPGNLNVKLILVSSFYI
jgi:hypothetical protein